MRAAARISIPGHRLQTSNTLLALYAGLDGVKTGHTDEAGWNLAASADRNGMRIYAILLGAPDEAHRDRDVARLLDWGFDRFQRARLVRAGQLFGRAGACAVVAARASPRRSIRASRCAGASCCRAASIAVRAGERLGYVELRSARGVLGRVPLVAGRAGRGRPALVSWLRSLPCL